MYDAVLIMEIWRIVRQICNVRNATPDTLGRFSLHLPIPIRNYSYVLSVVSFPATYARAVEKQDNAQYTSDLQTDSDMEAARKRR